MLLRQAAPGGVPAWQPWVGLVGVILCTVFLVWGAGRVFRVGLLSKGQPPSLRLLLKWAFRG
jgi:ABC-2 type transport system permease protein